VNRLATVRATARRALGAARCYWQSVALRWALVAAGMAGTGVYALSGMLFGAKLAPGFAWYLGIVHGLLVLSAGLFLARHAESERAPPSAVSDIDLLNSLNDAGQAVGVQLWDWDLLKDHLRFDRSVVELFGVEVGEVESNTQAFVARCIHPEDLGHYRTQLIRALKGEAPLRIDYRVVHKDGSIHPTQLRGQIFREPVFREPVSGEPAGDKLGRAIRILCITIDMSARVASEAQIAAQAERQGQLLERLRLTTEAAGIGVWDWDLLSGKLSADSDLALIFPDAELANIELAADFVQKILHPEDRDHFVAAMNAVVAHGSDERSAINFRYLRRDGGEQHVELHGRVLRDPQGRAQRFLGVSWNVTAKLEAQAEIERQAAAQRLLLERLNLATEVAGLDVWDWDLSTDRFVADAHMTSAYGGTRFDLPSGWKLISQVVHPQDVEDYLEMVNRSIATGRPLSYRYRMVLPDGKKRHVQVQARVFRDAENKAVRMLGVNMDKTDEVNHLEELRRQADGERTLRDRLNLATKTAGISVWDKDLLTGAFVTDEQFWSLLGIDQPDPQFRPYDGIHSDIRDKALAPINAALHDPSKNEVIASRHRTANPRTEAQYVQTHMRIFRDAYGKPVRILGVTWDVTHEVQHAEELERKAAHERALVQRLNLTTQAAGISPWEYDLKTDNFSWHGLRQAVFGLDDVPLADYLKALHALVLEADRPQLDDAMRHAMENNIENYSYLFRVRGIDGKIHHMRNICKLMRNARGNYRYVTGVTMDVTKEVEANALIAQRAEENRKLVERLSIATESANIGSWEMDLVEQRFLWVENPVKSLGIADADFRSLEEFSQHIVPEDRTLMPDNISRAIAEQTDRVGFRYRAIGRDGTTIHIQTFGRIIVDEQRRPLRALGVSWDITQEVAVAEQLQAQAEMERALLDRLSVATQAAGISPWEFDLKSNQYIWFGARLGVLGLDNQPLDTYYEALKNILLEEDREVLRDAAVEAFANNISVYSARYRARGIDGQIHYLKNFVRVLRSPRGTPYRLLGVTWDVSEEVAVNERLAQQVEHAQALKERLSIAAMAAGISPFEIDLTTGKFLWVENPIQRLRGIRGADSALSTFSHRIHPDDVNLFREEIVRAAKGGYDVVTYRYRAFANDDSIVHVETYAKLYFNEQRRATRALGVSWDATKEVATTAQLEQQALKERALTERLTIATQSAGISIWEVDLVTKRFLWVENPLAATSGAHENGSDLDRFSQRMHPDDTFIFRDAVRAAAKEGRDIAKYRYRCFRLDGSLAHVQAYAKLYFNSEARAVRALGVSWEVSNEVESAEQLRNAERRLERASLSSSEGHWEADLATRQLWCSSSFHTLLGYAAGELGNGVATLDKLVHNDDRESYLHALQAHLADNAPYDVETRLLTAQGEYRWFRMRGMAERDNAGVPTVMAGSIHDIHRQKAVEDALKQAQLRFERAINGTQDGLWELDVASGDTWCSPRLALLLGYPPQALEGTNFLLTLIHADDAGKVREQTAAHYRSNAPFDLEVRLLARSGEYRWYRARASAERNASGRALRLSGSLQDVTEARAAREELVRATEAASRAKSEFLANVSHEIRTPMNGIIGMTGLLLDTRLDRTQRDYADTIRGSADSLLTVINDILDFSKIEAGKLDLESIELDLRANVEEVGAMMAFQAATKGLELIVNVHPEVPERVMGDPQRLRQCLINLLGNAIKFTKSGEIAVDVCAVGNHEGRVLTHFEVRDTGMGIAEKTLKTLFQPFVQADSSTTRHFGGTGLGLSIVRRLVEMMGGQVGVVSEVGKGSTFFFTLSLTPVESTASDAMQLATQCDGKILIVDDNATNRRVLGSQLTHAGYRVTAAAGAVEALQLLASASAAGAPFDMVVTDFLMPEMDGAMLAERIGATPALANTRLVILTSLDRQGDTPRFAALGFAAFLTKPVRVRELLDCVQRVLSGEARQWQMESRPMITRNTLSEARSQQRLSGHVLVVEDNIVNQKVAARFLERLGCTVRVAEDGEEGVKACLAERFDIVLMDLQMPVMDGLTATQRIRESEQGRRTPIIALTANAMRGDQERCENAGMDGFLTKPIEVERLRDVLAKFGMADSTTNAATHPTVAEFVDADAVIEESHAPPVNLGRINEITGGDAEFAQELVATFIESGESQLQEVTAAIALLDRAALARAAHKLKGACANVYAHELLATALLLESVAATSGSAELGTYNERLRHEFARTKEFLNAALPTAQRQAS